MWSNSSRCRQESVYLSRTWCLYTWSYLDILITMLNFANCSTVIHSPTVKYLCSWQKPLVKPMASGSIFIILISQHLVISFPFLLCFYFTLHLYHKNTKNIIVSYLSDLTLVSDREGIDNPLSCWLRGVICFVQVLGDARATSYRIDTLVLKTEGNTYATSLHHPFLFGEIQRSAQEVAQSI